MSDDIIRMATEAGCGWAHNGTEPLLTGEAQIQRFAALVEAEKDKEIAELKHERRRDMAEICSLRESEESLREEVERLQADAESWRKTLGAAIALGGKNMEEIERLREALKAETARCSKVCVDSAERYEEARRGYWNSGLDVASRALRNAAAEMRKGAATHEAALRDAAKQMQAGAEK